MNSTVNICLNVSLWFLTLARVESDVKVDSGYQIFMSETVQCNMLHSEAEWLERKYLEPWEGLKRHQSHSPLSQWAPP